MADAALDDVELLSVPPPQPPAPSPTVVVPPDDFAVDGDLLLPAWMSPSRLADFENCPRRYFYTSVARLTPQATVAQTVGTLAHAALEQLFLLPRPDRCFDAIAGVVDTEWARVRGEAIYASLVAAGEETEVALLSRAKEMVANYFLMETPSRFDPVWTERRVYAYVDDVPLVGVIDRLDVADYPSGRHVVISDYKTGKVPKRDRYLPAKFEAMRIYGALVEQVFGLRPFYLRLLFVAGASKDAILREQLTAAAAAATRKRLRRLHGDITTRAKTGDWAPRPNTLCDWCDHRAICPAFAPPSISPTAAQPSLFAADSDVTELAPETVCALPLPLRRPAPSGPNPFELD